MYYVKMKGQDTLLLAIIGIIAGIAFIGGTAYGENNHKIFAGGATTVAKNDEKIVVEKEGITPDGKGVDIIVKKINLMKIPDDSDKGFVLNIKYKKNGKIYVDNFDTSKENVPSDKLVKYYESFIRKNFKGIVYEDEMSFE